MWQKIEDGDTGGTIWIKATKETADDFVELYLKGCRACMARIRGQKAFPAVLASRGFDPDRIIELTLQNLKDAVKSYNGGDKQSKYFAVYGEDFD